MCTKNFKEFARVIGSQPSSIYVKINYAKKNVLLSMRDKESNTACYLFNYKEFRILCNDFKILKGCLPEK